MSRKTHARSEERGLQPATDGVGPLLQRDYWAVLKGCSSSPAAVMTLVRERFFDFPPEELVVFRYKEKKEGLLAIGDALDVSIRMMKPVAVRVIHQDAHSLTLGTEVGHPEAGRITFGAYPNERQDVIFHIRSRARAGSAIDYAGFLTTGDPMQTETWTDYIDCLAHVVGEGIVGAIYVEEEEVEEQASDAAMDAPTFIARGQ